MSLTQYYTATSLDGFIADPDNSLEWLFTREREDAEAGLLDEVLVSMAPVTWAAARRCCRDGSSCGSTRSDGTAISSWRVRGGPVRLPMSLSAKPGLN